MALSLRSKFFALILLGVLLPLEGYMIYELGWYQRSLSRVFLQQARAIVNQVVIARRWLSQHGGVYVYKHPFVKSSPFMKNAETATVNGDPLTLLSPALVTRELSEFSAREGLARFRIVSSRPINPANLPDPWEAESLLSFEKGKSETWAMLGEGPRTRFRYMAPLRLEAACLRCHVEYKYRVGEVRGGISVEFPVGEMMAEARGHIFLSVSIIAALGLVIIAGLWIGTRNLLLRPLSQITEAVSAMSEGDYDYPLLPQADDELGLLATTVLEMRAILKEYNQRLRQEVEAHTRELNVMRAHAQKERDYLINIFERMADGVCVISDQERVVEYMNPRLTELFGPVKNRPCYQVIFSRDDPCPDCPLHRRGQEIIRREITVGGGTLVFDVLHSELRNPDGSRSWLLVFRDITERKKLEEQLLEMNRTLEAKVREQTAALLEHEKLASLGEISAGMAHEIRNPLSAILSGISLLESGRRTPEEASHILKLIKKEANRLNSSLTDFLLFARPQQPRKVRIDLAGLLREIAELIKQDPELKGEIEILLELSPLPPIWFDDSQLRQVIWNVVLNALQAMEGKGTLTLRANAQEDGFFRLEIQDTGPGIPDSIKDRIYDPFFSTKKEGTGLGLSIVRRIVQAHGGSLTFTSPPRGGCTFIITAPLGKEND